VPRPVIPGVPIEAELSIAEQLARLVARLDALERVPTAPEVQTRTFAAKEGQFLTVEAPTSGLVALLPKARPQNRGKRITFNFRNANPVRLLAVDGLVNNQPTVVSTSPGTFDAISDGATGWYVTQLATATGSEALRAVSAGTTLASSGTVALSNSNNVSFGLSGNTVTARVAAVALAAGTQTATSGSAVFANNGLITFGMSLSSQLTASHNGLRLISAGSTTLINPTLGLSLADSNGLSWGLNGSTLTAQHDALRSISLVTYASNVSSSFSNATHSTFSGSRLHLQLAGTEGSIYSRANVLWRFSSDSLVAVAPQLYVAANGASSANLVSMADTNDVSWSVGASVDPTLGRVVQLSASYLPKIGLVSHVGGNSASNVTRLAVSNASNVTWSLSTAAGAATIIASVAAQSAQTFIGGIAGGTQTATSGTIVFSNSNGVSFGLSGSTRMTADYAREIGLVSHVGGNAVSSVTRLAFSNASNVTWSLSTAANAATVLASVDAGAGGVAIAVNTSTISSGTARLFPSEDSTLAVVGNVSFNISGQSVQAAAAIVASNPGGDAFRASRLDFINSNGVTFGIGSTSNASGRIVNVTAKASPDLTLFKNWYDGSANVNFSPGNSSAMLMHVNNGLPFPGNMTLNTLELLVNGAQASTQSTQSFAVTVRLGLYSLANSTQLSLINSVSSTFSQNTVSSNSSASRNASFQGERRFSVHSSLWSSQPVLTNGGQYWLLVNISTAGTGILSQVRGYRQAQIGAGIWNNTSNGSRYALPFVGFLSTGAPPATIGTAAIMSDIPQDPIAPAVVFRNGIAGIP
jgi:hypothetical protein